jgi:hypothetical protein
MTIRYLNPVTQPDIASASLAPRLDSLEGIRIGLLSNGKTNAAKLLDMIAEELQTGTRLDSIVTRGKINAGSNCPPDIFKDLVDRCDAVITGLGD